MDKVPAKPGFTDPAHPISKILTADDLARVDTLGFRGEALHAIGAVSSLILTTCERGAEFGVRVGVFAGEIVESAPAAHPPGTTVEVRNLFLNLPVRRSFLGTERAEANAVSTVVEALALSRPQVGFFLRSEGRGVLTLPTAADLRERISQVHGLALARSLVALEDPVVWGFVSPLAVSFPTRRYTHVAVNGRVVDTDSFAPAISKAYADLLPKGRHPAAFLRLELGPGEVDVNVHPAKSAVRLRGGRSAYPLVVGTIRSALAPERDGRGAALPEVQGSAYPLVVGTIRAALAPEREIGGGTAPEEQVAELTPVGQFAGRCVIAQEGDELIILDQHGAHERILYERLSRNPEGTPVALPSPVVVRLPGDLAPEAWNFEAELNTLGFEFEPFGEGAVRVSKVPETVADAEAALVAALHALAGGEDLAKALACKGSTRFGESLSREEMEALLKEWSATEFKEICPHGRPIVKRLALADLLREFGRI